MDFLTALEGRYCLPEGYFARKLGTPNRHVIDRLLGRKIQPVQWRIIRWHLPDDFFSRPAPQQKEILRWIFDNVFDKSEFSSYISKVIASPYSIRFRQTKRRRSSRSSSDGFLRNRGSAIERTTTINAPPSLSREVSELVAYKTSKLAQIGFQRNHIWSNITVSIKVRHLGLLLGALSASPTSPIKGLGIPLKKLTLGMLLFPRIWDWFLEWRENRRGFYTMSESNLLVDLIAFTQPETGWLSQNPRLARALTPVRGFISAKEIERAKQNWAATCETARQYATTRVRDIRRMAVSHRDPFMSVLPILEADSPLGEYRKIADEVLKVLPSLERLSLEYAEAVRSYLLLRFGMHLGLRSRNLRELVFCLRGAEPRTERQLRRMLCGELRWNDKKAGWEVFVPYQAFKNHYSSFFEKRPFCLLLPDAGGLYAKIDEYITVHRSILLKDVSDPHTFFVRSFQRLGRNKVAKYNHLTFCDAWKTAVQRYGIYNPYTGRGAIAGLSPHGPHTIRDVLATHVLKLTGSYELASYAIQSTPENVMRHYGRFLPRDKSAQAAEVLNQTWRDV